MTTLHSRSLWKQLLTALVILTVSVACSPSTLAQPAIPPNSPPSGTPVASSSGATSLAVTLTATALTPTLASSSTNSPLPTLSNFNNALTFGGAGGGSLGGCLVPTYPPPTIYAFQDENYLHFISFCNFGYRMPVDVPIHLSVSSEDGKYTLQDDFQIQGDDETCVENHCTYWSVDYWWPTGLPGGVWHWEISWEGGGASGSLETRSSEQTGEIEMSVLDSLSYKNLRTTDFVVPCHVSAGSTGLTAIGRGFPPGSTIYLPIYEEIKFKHYQPYYVQTTFSDSTGSFITELSGPFVSGKSYVVISVWDPDDPYMISEGVLDPRLSGVDCFIVP